MQGLNPLIGILCFLVLAVATAFRGVDGLPLIVGLLALIQWWQAYPLAPVLRAVYRLRWFYLAISLVYLLAAPTMRWELPLPLPVIDAAGRIAVLLVLVWAAHVLVLASGIAATQSAIYTLARPLVWIGLRPERLAMRLALTLDLVAGQRTRLQDVLQRPGWLTRPDAIATLLADALKVCEQQAVVSEPVTVRVAPIPVASWQWIVLLVFVLAGLVI